jgi:hypothetical protein
MIDAMCLFENWTSVLSQYTGNDHTILHAVLDGNSHD